MFAPDPKTGWLFATFIMRQILRPPEIELLRQRQVLSKDQFLLICFSEKRNLVPECSEDVAHEKLVQILLVIMGRKDWP